MNTITEFLKEILIQPHFSNAKGEHEANTEHLLIRHGFAQSTLEEQQLSKSDIRNMLVCGNVAPLMYISQPCGSQSFPDFIVSDEDGKVFYIECKSSSQDKITWNSGKPKNGAIYIVSSGRHDAQTIVKGDHFWTEEETSLLAECFQKMKVIQKEYGSLLKQMNSKVSPYCREMHNDSQKVYGHSDRLSRVKAVFDYVRR